MFLRQYSELTHETRLGYLLLSKAFYNVIIPEKEGMKSESAAKWTTFHYE